MSTYNYKEEFTKLGALLDRHILRKAGEDVSTVKCPEACQGSYGKSQTEEIDKDAIGNANQENPETVDKAAPAIAPEVPRSGTDGETDKTGEGMKVQEKPESTSKAAAFARGLANAMTKQESAKEAKPEEAEYITGVAMFNKKAALMNAKEDELEAASKDFYESLDSLHRNPMFQQVFAKRAALKMAEDVAAAMEAGAPAGSEEEIAAALQQAINEDPELAAELEGEITGEAIDDLAAAEQQAAVVDQIAQASGVAPEDVIQAAQLIEDAAAENNMPVDQFVEMLDAAMQEGATGEAPAAAPVEEGEAAAKEASLKSPSLRRLEKAAALAAAKDAQKK